MRLTTYSWIKYIPGRRSMFRKSKEWLVRRPGNGSYTKSLANPSLPLTSDIRQGTARVKCSAIVSIRCRFCALVWSACGGPGSSGAVFESRNRFLNTLLCCFYCCVVHSVPSGLWLTARDLFVLIFVCLK